MLGKELKMVIGRISALLWKPESLYPLVMVRLMFGIVMAGWALGMIINGSLFELFAGNGFVFHYQGFDWVKPPGEIGMYLLFGLVIISSLMLAAGLFFKASTTVFLFAFSYIALIDKSNYLSYYYFVIIMSVMLLVSPAHRLFSIDLLRKPFARVDYVPAWFMLAMKIQVVLVFFFAGMAKLNYDWLFEGRPFSIWTMEVLDRWGVHIDLVGEYKWLAILASWFLILSDFIFPHFLLDRKTAYGAYWIFFLMQLISILFLPVGFFPVLFIVSCLIFLPPAGIHEFISRVSYFLYDIFQFKGDVFKRGGGYLLQYRNKRLAILLIGVFLAFQVSWPVVAYLKWGTLKWVETMFHFSWNMELAEKNGTVKFWEYDPVSKQQTEISLDSFLTIHQQRFMAQNPRMIIQFTDYLRQRLPPNKQIRAELSLSLNGHNPIVVVDKSKDLHTQLVSYTSMLNTK